MRHVELYENLCGVRRRGGVKRDVLAILTGVA